LGRASFPAVLSGFEVVVFVETAGPGTGKDFWKNFLKIGTEPVDGLPARR
jgi:hypothetical protein